MALSILRSRILMVTSKQAQMASRNMLYSSSTTAIRNMTAVCALGVRNMTNSTKDELYRQVIVEVKGHDRTVLNSYEKFTTMAAQELGVHVERIYEPPRIFTRMSLLKSVFVHKKHFHQYEMRTLFRVFELKYLTGSTASTFLEYIQRNLPEGMAMKVTKHHLEKIPEHIKAPGPAAQPKKVIGSDQDSLSDSGKKSKSSSAVSSSSTETSTPSVSTSSPKYSSTSSSSSDTSSTSASKTDATSKDASKSESKKTKKSESQHTSKNKTQV